MMTPKKKTGSGVMIPRSARTGMAKGGMATSVKKKVKKSNGGGVMVPRSARRPMK